MIQADPGATEPLFYACGPRISTLTYQSRALSTPAPEELSDILKKSRSRNRATGVTGMLLYSQDRFFQWLEGPEDSLNAIWDSIQNDERHTHIELLNRDSSQHRLFSEWDMRLVSPDASFEAACQQSQARRSMPPKLVELSAQLALDGRLKPLREGFEEVLMMGVDISSVYAGLVEPAARLLGDWWRGDVCNEREIALALSSLRSAVRDIPAARMPAPATDAEALQILLVPPPQESHVLGVSLASDLYHQAGCPVVVEFPESAEAVGKLVRGQWFDVVTIAMSEVFSRSDRIDVLISTIHAARRESRNPKLVVVVGGRAFSERPELLSLVGADVAYTTLADIVATTRQGVEAMRETRSIN